MLLQVQAADFSENIRLTFGPSVLFYLKFAKKRHSKDEMCSLKSAFLNVLRVV